MRTKLTLSAIALLIAITASADPAPLALKINGRDLGVQLLDLSDEGDVRIPRAVLLAAGIKGGALPEGELLSPAQFALDYQLDEDTAAFLLSVDPGILPQVNKDLNTREQLPPPPANHSIYLNYALNMNRQHGQLDWQAPLELGLRQGDWMFNNTYTITETDHQRGQTSLQRDDMQGLWRLSLGDVGGQSGPLGGSGAFAGLRVATAFNLQPGFVASPSVQVNYVLDSPAEVEVWVDGRRVAVENLPAGPLQLDNLPALAGRAGTVRLVIRDAFGQTREFETDFYISSRQLQRGTHHFSYTLGVPREGGDHYDNHPALLLEHRTGFSDSITGGLFGSVDETVWQAGLELAGAHTKLGEWSLAINGGGEQGKTAGAAAQIGYNLNTSRVLLGISAIRRSQYFRAVGLQGHALTRADARIGFTGWLRGFNLGFSYNSTQDFDDGTVQLPSTATERRKEWRIGYNRTLFSRLTCNFSAQHDTLSHDTRATLTFHYLFGRALTTSRFDWLKGGQRSWQNRLSRSGDGFLGDGYAFEAERVDSPHGDTTHNGRADYDFNSQYGTARLSYRRNRFDSTGSDTWDARMAGGAAWTGGAATIGRPIRGGFAIVDTDGIEGVDVYHNSQKAGTSGNLPILLSTATPYYPQNVNLQLPDSLPLGMRVNTTQQTFRVWERGGSRLTFPVERLNSYEGRIQLRYSDGSTTAAEFGGLNLYLSDGSQRSVALGEEGFFYVEQLPPGNYRAEISWKDQICELVLSLPDNDQIFSDLGTQTCHVASPSST